MSNRGYAYVGHVQLPWEGKEENEERGWDYLKWPKTRYGIIRRLEQFVSCSTAEWKETITD